MKKLLPLLLGALLVPCLAQADSYRIFKAAALFPVQIEAVDAKGNDIIIKKTLGTQDIINLALGQKPLTINSAKTAVLAVAKNISFPDRAKLVVFNPTTDTVVAVVCSMQPGTLLNQRAAKTGSDLSRGDGLCFGTIVATVDHDGAGTVSDPTKNGFLAVPTPFVASAVVTNTPTATGPIIGLSAKGMIGAMQLRTTDRNGVVTLYDGVLVNGMFVSTGKALTGVFPVTF